MPWQISLSIGLVFSSIAAGMAFLITYEEYSRHPQLHRSDVLKQSLNTAAVVFAFFAVVAFLAGIALGSIVQGEAALR